MWVTFDTKMVLSLYEHVSEEQCVTSCSLKGMNSLFLEAIEILVRRCFVMRQY